MSNPIQGGVYYWDKVPANHPMGDKNRRWVVVSRVAFNEHSDHVLACPVTSYPPTALDIGIKKTPHNSLDHDSAMIVPMITSILKKELSDLVGRAGTRDMRQVLDRLRVLVEV